MSAKTVTELDGWQVSHHAYVTVGHWKKAQDESADDKDKGAFSFKLAEQVIDEIRAPDGVILPDIEHAPIALINLVIQRVAPSKEGSAPKS